MLININKIIIFVDSAQLDNDKILKNKSIIHNIVETSKYYIHLYV